MSNKRAPVIFVGHGSPMNAIETNDFTRALSSLRELYPQPRAVLCISAHWMTEGTWITHQAKPKTIHDFYGFPDELFAVQYPASGDPKIAEKISQQIENFKINLEDETWGYDHGTWSVLRHIFPNADVPVLQLSLDMSKLASYHYQLGQALRPLRDENILIIGSGNIVHNLQKIRWESDAPAFPWAQEFDSWSKKYLEARDFNPLIESYLSFEAGKLSVPTNDHYFPMLYVLGASDESDTLRFHYEGIQNASISMLTLSFS